MVTEMALVASQASGIGVVPIIVIVAFAGFVGLFLLISTVKIEESTAKGNGQVIPSLLDKLVGGSDQQGAEEEEGASVS